MSDGSSAKKRIPPRWQQASAEVRRRAEELEGSGFPLEMAWDVALGTLDFNEALERLARREAVTKLMQRHGLSKALATQVALGHADLDRVLFRREFQAHREAHRSKTCLVEGADLTLFCWGGVRRQGQVVSAGPYEVSWKERGEATAVKVHKLEIQYATEGVQTGDGPPRGGASTSASLRPQRRPQDRYHCSDRRLYTQIKEGREVCITLLDDQKFYGRLLWFSRYELGLALGGGGHVVIFRHAVARLQSVGARKGV